jgi:hypothetical protein
LLKKLGIQIKRLEILVCYDFHFGISDDKKDVMFAIELDLFSIGTITLPIHIEPILKLFCIPDIMAEPILKQLVVPINVFNYEVSYIT